MKRKFQKFDIFGGGYNYFVIMTNFIFINSIPMKNTVNKWPGIISKEAYKSKGMNWLKEIDKNLIENLSNLAQILLLMQEWKWKYHFEDVPDEKIAEAVTFYTTLNEQERTDLKEWIESVLRVIVEEKRKGKKKKKN